MKEFKIARTYEVSDVKEISVDWNGHNFLVIYGNHINGGFFSIPNWNVGGELAFFDDILWNTESIGRSLKNYDMGEIIAKAIKSNELDNN